MAIKYKWLAGRLELMVQRRIQEGVPKLPSEQELCARYHVSRQTVRMALGILEDKGLIRRVQGSGSHITGLSASSQDNRIGILLSSDQEYIYPGVLHDIRSTLSQSGFSHQIFVTENCVSREREILVQILAQPLRGIIVEGCKSALPNPNVNLYRQLAGKGCQILFLYNYYPELPGCLYIKDNNLQGSHLLVQHLADQGHRAIGGIFKADDMQGVERYQGFAEAMLTLDLPFSDRQVCWYGSHQLDLLLRDHNTGFLRDMILESLTACTAVVCYNDLIAYYLVEELLLAGYRLPVDLAIAAFDNTYLSNSDILTMTTLSHKPHHMGQAAAEAMIQMLKGLPVTSRETDWELNRKESTQTDPELV